MRQPSWTPILNFRQRSAGPGMWVMIGCAILTFMVPRVGGSPSEPHSCVPILKNALSNMAGGMESQSSAVSSSPPDERDLLFRALLDEDPYVRGKAAMLLGMKGGMDCIHRIEPLLRDPDAAALNYAMAGLTGLLGHYDFFDPELGGRFSPVLSSIEQSLMEIVRVNGDANFKSRAMFLLNKFPRLDKATIAELRSIAAGRKSPAFLTALRVLDLRGVDVGDLVAETLSVGVFGRDTALARSLGTCQIRHVPEIQLLLESKNPITLFHTRAALERLGDPESDSSLASLRAMEVEKMGVSLNRVAANRLGAARWEDVARGQLLEDAHRARLVLFGEVHSSDGPLREGQVELLRAFAGNNEHDALGYEPGVESAQAGVLQAARDLGMRVIPLERNWESLCSEFRITERDNEAAATINEFLGDDKANRMFVIRGEEHVSPGGFLVGQLRVEPMIVLSTLKPRFDSSEGPPKVIRTSDARIASGERVYLWALPEEARSEYKILIRWMQAQPGDPVSPNNALDSDPEAGR